MTKLKKLLPYAVIPSLMGLASNIALADEFDAMHKQLNIMSKIIKSSATAGEGRNASRVNGVESVYLKGQGVVFTVNSSSRHSTWGNYNFNFVLPEVAPVPPVPPVAPKAPSVAVEFDNDFTVEVNEQVEHAMEIYERAMDSLHEEREVIRELREEQRDLAYEVRDLEREKRDLEFQMRRADDQSRKELEQHVKQIEEKRKAIEQSRAKLAEQSAKLRQEQVAQRKEQERERQSYYKALSQSLAEAFCYYGNGLKALPRDEHVSLIIKSAGEKDGNRYKDKIYVFSKKDITDCASDKINVAKLLEKGSGYQF